MSSLELNRAVAATKIGSNLDGRTCKSKLGTKGSNGTQVQLESKPNKFLTKVVMITIVCSTVCLGMF